MRGSRNKWLTRLSSSMPSIAEQRQEQQGRFLAQHSGGYLQEREIPELFRRGAKPTWKINLPLPANFPDTEGAT